MCEAWAARGQPAVIGPAGGGNRNAVWELRLGDQRLVGRRSRRSAASLDWELDLLDHLARHGLRVPAVVPTLDGRRHLDGIVVQSWLDGVPPGRHDWPDVRTALGLVHQVTREWAQRPGFASTGELLTADRGGDVDLSIMPADAVAACRQAWARLAGTPAGSRAR